MKRCPKCHAGIEENARFCLYCMTSFEPKEAAKPIGSNKKRWLFPIAAVLAVAVLLAIALSACLGGEQSPQSSENGEVVSTQTGGTTESTADAAVTNTVTDTTAVTTSGSGTKSRTTSGKAATVAATTQKTTTVITAHTTVKTAAASTATYTYRAAKYGDDFSVAADLENCVVITGVEKTASDGNYVIPSTIDGKKVVAVMGLAFSDERVSDTVKTVTIPETVKTIWNYAFSGCRNMTDIYFCGNAVYTEAKAFADASERNGTLTIHCSSACSDRNFRYYKTCAASYDAVYAEWNG